MHNWAVIITKGWKEKVKISLEERFNQNKSKNGCYQRGNVCWIKNRAIKEKQIGLWRMRFSPVNLKGLRKLKKAKIKKMLLKRPGQDF